MGIILDVFKGILQEGDVRINPASCPGPDIWLSPLAQSKLSIVIECKNHQKTKPFEWIKQAKSYSKHGEIPVVVFSRNHEDEPYAIIPFKDLVALIMDRNIDLTKGTK